MLQLYKKITKFLINNHQPVEYELIIVPGMLNVNIVICRNISHTIRANSLPFCESQSQYLIRYTSQSQSLTSYMTQSKCITCYMSQSQSLTKLYDPIKMYYMLYELITKSHMLYDAIKMHYMLYEPIKTNVLHIRNKEIFPNFQEQLESIPIKREIVVNKL